MVLDGIFDHNSDEADTGYIERQKIRESCKRKVKEEACERCSKFISVTSDFAFLFYAPPKPDSICIFFSSKFIRFHPKKTTDYHKNE
jgi:hypothetical protein